MKTTCSPLPHSTFLLCNFRRFLLLIVILSYLHPISSLLSPSHTVLDLEPNEGKETAIEETEEGESPT